MAIKRQAGGHAHSFDPQLRSPISGNTVNGAVISAGHEQIAGAIDSQAAGIHQRSDKRFDAEIRGNFVKRTGTRWPRGPLYVT
jgi:hypothetical protein